MKELNDILRAYASLRDAGERACLATVVEAHGSTYRHPGARMLVRPHGPTVGTISSGCLDHDLIEHATEVMASGTPKVVTYDSSSPDDIVWGMNLGCGGVIRVLLEPLSKERSFDHLEILAGWMKDRYDGGMATLYGFDGRPTTPLGARYLLRRDGWTATDMREQSLLEQTRDALAKLLHEDHPDATSCTTAGGTAHLFLEKIAPPFSLIIVGAGPDAVPLAAFAKNLGWNVTVVDPRPGLLRRDQFPDVDAMILAYPEEIPDRLSLTGGEAVVIMTHHFDYDYKLLRTLLPSPARYIGFLASRGKSGELLKRLADEGVPPTDEQLTRLYTPVGLDIGGETPEQIALAIVAEIQAVVAGRAGGFLRSRNPTTQRTMHEARQRAT